MKVREIILKVKSLHKREKASSNETFTHFELCIIRYILLLFPRQCINDGVPTLTDGDADIIWVYHRPEDIKPDRHTIYQAIDFNTKQRDNQVDIYELKKTLPLP